MQQNADFVDAIYWKIKGSTALQQHYQGKKIVMVLDNAPAHNQTEERVLEYDDLVLLRLRPYSPMCNPIENYFRVLKAHIKASLAMNNDEMMQQGSYPTMTERRMVLLEDAAKEAFHALLYKYGFSVREFSHALRWMAAQLMEDM